MAGQNPAQQLDEAVRKRIASMTPSEILAIRAQMSDEERIAQARAEEEEVRKRLVIVRFTRAYKVFNGGEQAGLAPAEAFAAIAEGFCKRVGGATPQEPAPAGEDPQAETLRAKLDHLVRYIGSFDEDDGAYWDDNGLPKLDKLSSMVGMPVSEEERNEAWKMFQGKSEAA